MSHPLSAHLWNYHSARAAGAHPSIRTYSRLALTLARLTIPALWPCSH